MSYRACSWIFKLISCIFWVFQIRFNTCFTKINTLKANSRLNISTVIFLMNWIGFNFCYLKQSNLVNLVVLLFAWNLIAKMLSLSYGPRCFCSKSLFSVASETRFKVYDFVQNKCSF